MRFPLPESQNHSRQLTSMPLGYRAPWRPTRGKWFFLTAFSFACLLFWWLPSIVYRFVVQIPDPVENSTIGLSILALIVFMFGYLQPASGGQSLGFSGSTLDACCDFTYKVVILLFVLALPMALAYWRTEVTTSYGSADPIPRLYQVVFYTHMFLGFMCIGSCDPESQGWRRIRAVAALVILPRVIVSLHGGRFFLVQAVVPGLLIALARGWIRFSFKRLIQLALVALALIFAPSLTRGDFTQQSDLKLFFISGGSLRLFQDNADLNLNGRCPPLLVSFTAKAIPWGALGICVMDIAGLQNLPATLDRILTVNDPNSFQGTSSGTGSNYLLDLYLFGGFFAVCAGSALFGFSCRRFMEWIGKRSLFAGIWAESLTRALFAPRSALGYVYEWIPPLVLATLLVMFTVRMAQILEREISAQTSTIFNTSLQRD